MLMFGEEANRPAGSMEEDLKALNLGHLFESSGSKRAAAVDDEAATPRTEVPVRQEGAGEQDYGATKATEPPADADKGGEEKPAGDDESGEKPAPPAPPAAPKGDGEDKGDDDEMKESIDAVLNMTEQDVDGLDEDELEGALHVVHALEDIAENPSPKLEAAFAVVDSFYSQLAEGETNTIDRDTLVGVVEAMEHILADFGVLGEMHGFSGAVMRHAARAKAHGKMGATASMTKQHKVKEMKVKLGKKHAFKKGLESFKPPAMHHGKGHGAKHEDENSLSAVVGNLTALRDSLKENAQAAESTGELAEGLKAVGETATAWYEAIAKEIKSGLSEGKQVEENDPRVLIGRHLEGIASDAAENLSTIESGAKINMEAAESNLRNLAADLNDIAEVMKSVE